MELLTKHIERLLVGNTCVIVPGIGGFVTRWRSAERVDGMLLAPHREIGFNPLLSHDDGLLIESFMQAENISYLSAKSMVAERVARMRRTLKHDGSISFGRVGTLSIRDEKLIFEPDSTDFLPENLGLRACQLRKIEVLPTLQALTDNDRTIIRLSSSARAAMRVAAVFVALMVVSLLTPNYVTDTQTAGFLTLSSLYPPLSDSSSADFDVPPADTLALAPSTPIQAPVVKADAQRYHLIVASLATQAEAEKFCNNFEARHGDTLQILKSPGQAGKFRISAGSFSSRAEAVTAMETARQERPNMARSWVLAR